MWFGDHRSRSFSFYCLEAVGFPRGKIGLKLVAKICAFTKFSPLGIVVSETRRMSLPGMR